MMTQEKLEKATLAVALFTSFMGPFMISAVNVAMPAIQRDFSASAVALGWIAMAYLLTTAVFLVPMGKLGDIYGRKKFFVTGLGVFTVATFSTGFSWSIGSLIAFRVIQAVGASIFITTGLAILTSVFPPEKRGRALGLYAAAVYIGLSVGPTVGGTLIFHFTWRAIFWMAAPFGILSIFVTLRFLDREWRNVGERFDLAGSLVYGATIFCLIFGATRIQTPVGWILVVCGAIGLIGFARLELSKNDPVFEVRLFKRNQLFSFSCLAALINYAATFAVTFLMSLYLQYIKGYTAQITGFILIAQPVVQAIVSPFAGRLSDRFEPRLISSCGMGLSVLGLLQLVFLGSETPTWYVICILATLGCGFALFSSPNMNAIMSAVEKRHYGIASGAVATMRVLGQTVSMATTTLIFALLLGKSQIVPANYALFMKSLTWIFIIFASLCTVGILFSLGRGSLRAK